MVDTLTKQLRAETTMISHMYKLLAVLWPAMTMSSRPERAYADCTGSSVSDVCLIHALIDCIKSLLPRNSTTDSSLMVDMMTGQLTRVRSLHHDMRCFVVGHVRCPPPVLSMLSRCRSNMHRHCQSDHGLSPTQIDFQSYVELMLCCDFQGSQAACWAAV